MAKLNKEEFINSLKEMNIQEIMELINAMKEEWGIDPTAAVATAAPTAQEDAETQTAFSVVLKSDGGKKIPVIKIVKELFNLGLMEAKTLVESAPKVLKENVSQTEANELKEKLVAAGAEIEIK
ncbi:MAG: 50S ribosomal protein L7/L12 [Mycoplasma sp.]|nr:50S ribosomal protein L7/L12 [Mycoplasma sp.]